MTETTASAPGKLFLSGEYAVLEGAPAVVTAIDRRAVAVAGGAPAQTTALLDAARDEVANQLGDPATRATWPVVTAESNSFSDGDAKLGLGSSAAVAVAACGALFEWSGRPIAANRGRVLELATAAHRTAQGKRGSGADVAAAALGGTIIFTPGQPVESITLAGVELAFVWTGRSASTVELLDRYAALARRDPATHREHLDELIAIARPLAQAYRDGDGAAIVRGSSEYGAALQRLGKSAGAPIVTPTHQLIAQLAAACGGAAKPSGAGGGDMAMAIFTRSEHRSAFVASCREQRLDLIELRPGAPGLRAEAGL